MGAAPVGVMWGWRGWMDGARYSCPAVVGTTPVGVAVGWAGWEAGAGGGPGAAAWACKADSMLSMRADRVERVAAST